MTHTGTRQRARQGSIWHRSVPRPGNGMAVAGLVCGIGGILIFGVVLGVLAVVFGSIGLARANRGAGHRRMAISGIVLGGAGIVYWALVLGLMNH
jgi:hypothetical protein